MLKLRDISNWAMITKLEWRNEIFSSFMPPSGRGNQFYNVIYIFSFPLFVCVNLISDIFKDFLLISAKVICS